ncbi:hypothetical protein FKQ62_12935 [Vibrio sp. B1-2]|nr:hypothetical protein [Vibrio sp. B1-2]
MLSERRNHIPFVLGEVCVFHVFYFLAGANFMIIAPYCFYVQRCRTSYLNPSFLVKSDEWIYEKEHRIILPLVTADRIIVHEAHLPDIEFYAESPEVLEKKFIGNSMYLINIKEPLLDEISRLIRYDGDYIYREDLVLAFVDRTINEYLRRISKDPRTIFLYRIPEKAIKSVYFGCKVDPADKEYIVDRISNNKELRHIKLYQAEVSDKRFELNFKTNKLFKSDS